MRTKLLVTAAIERFHSTFQCKIKRNMLTSFKQLHILSDMHKYDDKRFAFRLTNRLAGGRAYSRIHFKIVLVGILNLTEFGIRTT